LLPGEKPIESGSPVRVALLEDYPPLRDSIQQLVSAHARYRWLGGWGTLPKLLHGLAAEPADVVLMDLQLGAAMDGIGATAEVRRRFPRTAVLVLTLFDQPEFVFKALRAGAVGYILKSSTPSEILAAIEEVAAGGAPMTGQIARLVIERFHRCPPADASPGLDSERPGMLSQREVEVLGSLAQGCRYKEVAHRLGVSHNTIRSHVRRIFEKLHANGTIEAARKAREAGILIPEP